MYCFLVYAEGLQELPEGFRYGIASVLLILCLGAGTLGIRIGTEPYAGEQEKHCPAEINLSLQGIQVSWEQEGE